MAIPRYLVWANTLTGGGDYALDKIDGSELSDLHGAVVITATTTYFYSLDADSGATENSPSVISPDTNAGDKRWILVGTILTNIGLKLLDTNASHTINLKWNENDTANRIFNLLVNGADRTLDLSENFTIADGYNVILQALGQANSLILNESLTIGDGYSGTLTFSAASKVATIEDTTIGNNSAYVDGPLSPMVLSGCVISNGTTAGKIKVGAGTVLLRTSATEANVALGVLRKYSIAETDDITLTNADTLYFVQADWSSGEPIFSVGTTRPNGQTIINIGRAMREVDNTRHFRNTGYRLADGMASEYERVRDLREYEFSGCGISDDGLAEFKIAAGTFYRGPVAYDFSLFDSGVGKFTYVLYYGGAWHYEADQTIIDVNNYNDVTDAVDGLATCNKYKCDWVFVHPDDGHVYVVYGQDNSILGTIDESGLPSGIPDLVDVFGVLIGRIIIDGGVATFLHIEMTNAIQLISSPIIDHNDNSNIQGGTTDEYYHLTGAEYTEFQAGYITEALFDADTFLYATDDNTPVATSPANVMAALSGHAGAEFLFNTQKVGGVVDPTTDQQVATKKYVDDNVGAATLAALTDTTITGPADLDLLQYDNGSSKWVDRTFAEAGVQVVDATLTAFASLLTAANKIPYATGEDTGGELDLATTVGTPGSDTTLVSEQGIREAIDAGGGGVGGVPWSYRIATAESVTISAYEQLLIYGGYLIEGSGALTINSTGQLAVIGA